MANIKENLTTYVDAGKKYISEINKTEINTTENLSLFRVGKPCSFPTSVDKGHRIKKYIESKMNIIDLIPCSYKLPLTKTLEGKSWEDRNVIVNSIKPEISYKGAIEKFVNMCSAYNLPSNYGGLRLYLTDDTTSTDEFSNTYQDNWLSSKFNAFANARNQLAEIGRSVGDDVDAWVKDVASGVEGGLNTVIDGLTNSGGNGEETSTANKALKGLARAGVVASTIVATGNKLSLPKIWSDSSYSPNFNAVIKLVSPYGHPDAIREFIIKPLMYLLILSSARSDDKISYGQGPKLTVKAYGITNLPLASISGISLRKGGGDTSFNIYRQPLSIDVSLTFQSLIPSFAIERSPDKRDQFQDYAINDNMSLPTVGNTFFSNMGTVIESIKPVAISEIARDYTQGNRLPGEDLAYNESVFAIEGKALADARADRSNLQIAALQSQDLPPIIPKSADSLAHVVAETAKRAADESSKLQASYKEAIELGNLYAEGIKSRTAKDFNKLLPS